MEFLKSKSKGKKIVGLVAILYLIFGVSVGVGANQKPDNPKANLTSQKDVSESSSSSVSSYSDNKNLEIVDGLHGYKQSVLKFDNQKQMVLEDLDSLGRAVNAHIQLSNKDEDGIEKRGKIEFNPVGWHNYNFYYETNDAAEPYKKAWVMNRGHLVGYQFCGLNDEGKNLVPETTWLNTGNYTGMDDGNKDSMLYYENRLDQWLEENPDYYLDYQVTPFYYDDNLIPSKIRLSYVGIDKDGNHLKISLDSDKENAIDEEVTTVFLDNTAPNIEINYWKGTATAKITDKTVQDAKQASEKASSSAAAQASSEEAARASSEAVAQSAAQSSEAAQSRADSAAAQAAAASQAQANAAAAQQANQAANSPTQDGNWSVAPSGMVYARGDSKIMYHRVTNPGNYTLMSEADAAAAGYRAPKNGGNEYARW
jgi:DNA-entry nuclease